MRVRHFLLAILAFVVSTVTVPPRARAESSAIAEQQLKYRAARQIWEQRRLPAGLPKSAGVSEAKQTPRSSGTPGTAMLLNNVDFEVADGIGFSVKRLVISFEPKKPGAPIDLDKVDSFVIRLERGEVVMRSSALSALFNKHVLDYSGHPLAGMKMKTTDGRLSAKSTMVLCNCLGDHGIPSKFSGTIALTADNKLAFKLDEIEGMGIPVADVMKSLGITLPTLINLKRPGIALKDFTIELDHRKMFPLPELGGDIAAVRLTADGLHITFADAPKAELDPPAFLKGSYIWIQSGDPKFFGAVVTNAQIAMIPADENRKLRFNLYGYRKQLAAAKATIGTDGLMVVRIP